MTGSPAPEGIVFFSRLPVTSWVNGQGSTVELTREPPTGEYGWRLSIATVDRATSFSTLPGIDRSLMPLNQDGLALTIDGAPRDLAQYERLDFAGEQTVSSMPQWQEGKDLNLMVRRGLGAPRLQTVAVDGMWEHSPGDVAGIMLSGHLRTDGRTLTFGDTVLRGRIRGSGVIAIAGIDAP